MKLKLSLLLLSVIVIIHQCYSEDLKETDDEDSFHSQEEHLKSKLDEARDEDNIIPEDRFHSNNIESQYQEIFRAGSEPWMKKFEWPGEDEYLHTFNGIKLIPTKDKRMPSDEYMKKALERMKVLEAEPNFNPEVEIKKMQDQFEYTKNVKTEFDRIKELSKNPPDLNFEEVSDEVCQD